MSGTGTTAFFIDKAASLETSTTLGFELQKHHQTFDGAGCRIANTTDISSNDWVDFDPGRGESTAPAKFVCNMCVHQDQCLNDALNRNDTSMIWGGSSARERKAIVKAYYNELGAGTISESMTKGEFGVMAREDFVKVPKPTAKKTSYPPKVMRKAKCLTDASDTFEELDSTKFADLSKDLLATAMASCVDCPNLGDTCNGVGVETKSGVTVVNGEIVGKPPKSVIPTKKLINEKLDDIRARAA